MLCARARDGGGPFLLPLLQLCCLDFAVACVLIVVQALESVIPYGVVLTMYVGVQYLAWLY